LQVYQSEIKANLYIFDFELTDEYMTTFGVETPVSRAGGLHHTPFGSSEAKVCCGRAANLCGSASFLINTVLYLTAVTSGLINPLIFLTFPRRRYRQINTTLCRMAT
jgi:hypothetical protein